MIDKRFGHLVVRKRDQADRYVCGLGCLADGRRTDRLGSERELHAHLNTGKHFLTKAQAKKYPKFAFQRRLWSGLYWWDFQYTRRLDVWTVQA